MGYQPKKYHWIAYSGSNQEERDKGKGDFIFGTVFCHWQCYICFVFLFLLLPAVGMAAASVLSRKGSWETSRKANAFQPQLALHLIHALFHILTVGITALSSGKPCYAGACVHPLSPVSLEESDTSLPNPMGNFAF